MSEVENSLLFVGPFQNAEDFVERIAHLGVITDINRESAVPVGA